MYIGQSRVTLFHFLQGFKAGGKESQREAVRVSDKEVCATFYFGGSLRRSEVDLLLTVYMSDPA